MTSSDNQIPESVLILYNKVRSYFKSQQQQNPASPIQPTFTRDTKDKQQILRRASQRGVAHMNGTTIHAFVPQCSRKRCKKRAKR